MPLSLTPRPPQTTGTTVHATLVNSLQATTLIHLTHLLAQELRFFFVRKFRVNFLIIRFLIVLHNLFSKLTWLVLHTHTHITLLIPSIRILKEYFLPKQITTTMVAVSTLPIVVIHVFLVPKFRFKAALLLYWITRHPYTLHAAR